ncbi:MAG: hypothetical protein QM778_30190 [Myxococcales bacterium]
MSSKHPRLALPALLVLASCSPASDHGPTQDASPMPDARVADAAAPDAADDSGPALGCDPSSTTLPKDVFCTGLYKDRDPTRHPESVQPYTPGVTLWSDGAEKQRYLQLPPGAQIDTSQMDAWKFPVGTKAWKEFRFDGKLVETRIFWKTSDTHWESGTYIWDAANTSATLNEDRKPVILPSGYEIPTARDCGKCHHGGSDQLLGVEAVALALPSAQGVTLAGLSAAHSLSAPPATASVTLPEDATGKAGAALGYLHANCGMPCHSARGLGDETQLVLRLRADEFWPSDAGTAPVAAESTDAYRATVNQAPTTASVAQAFPGALRISPGSHEQSLLWQLTHRRGNYQMPPLVTHKIDDVGTQKIADWIDALSPSAPMPAP